MGAYWSAANMIFSLILLVILDFLVLPNSQNEKKQDSVLPTFFLVLSALVHFTCVLTLVFGVYTSIIESEYMTFAAISTGLNSGLLGITSAHELIHRKEKLLKILGISNLVTCLYGHFYIEHRKGHHALVGTMEDPATARKGETYYSFLLRTIPGQWLSAIKIEMERLKRVKANPVFPFNFSVNIALFQTILLLAIFIAFGSDVLYVFVIQALVAVFLLEYVNYIEHYGLIREKGEKVDAHHAWQSDSATSRFTLFELSRHSHHHMDAKVEYQNLESFPSGFRLPFGYYGMFYIALIPPLWFKIMNPRLNKRS